MGEGQQEEIPCEIPGWAPMAWLVIPAVTIRYDTVCFGMVHIRIVRVSVNTRRLKHSSCNGRIAVVWWSGGLVVW